MPSDYRLDAPAQVDPTNPKQAFGDKKPPLHLVPPALALGAAVGLKEGVIKGYGAYNWRQTKVRYTTYLGAIMRHCYAILDGEDTDPQSVTAKLHIEGIAANVAIALDALYGGFLVDDRPPKGPGAELARREIPLVTPKLP